MRFMISVLAAAMVVVRAEAAEPVRLTEEDVVIPTYLSGPPDRNPMFYFGRQSQGAEGRIYPYPLYDNLTNERGERRYHLVSLENEYVKLGILPEIGGRLFSAVDKSNGYDFVYRQHVIKPALIGLIGAWISGGIEWNIPHHHRASTFIPVQWRVESNPDGSMTVWVGELEIRHRMRWAVGYTLRPGSSVLACKVRILNRTPLPHSMLCFANVAVHANDDYQIIFPPATQWVTYHGKSEFASWPIAHSQYRGADFTAGVDVSWYRNHTNANSMFAWNYTDDFFGGYDHGKEAGTMSVADHHVVPGKKFWTWGSGPRGRMWDDILTDTDGPYVELMTGAYSDNQPDYSWMQPYETRSFTMNWYPFRDIGGVKNANLDAAVNLESANGSVTFGFHVTSAHPDATVRLAAGEAKLLEEQITIDPGHPYLNEVTLPAGIGAHDLRASISAEGRELVAYAPLQLDPQPEPEPVRPSPAPEEIKHEEALVLAGLRIDQFHDPRRDAEPYWEEALRRDPGDTAAHIGLGEIDLRRARFANAEAHFRQALERLTEGHTAPRDAEAFYDLGVALKAQGKSDEALDAFYKATWDQAWRAPAYYSLSELAAAREDFASALDYVDRSLDANALNLRAYGLKAAALRHLGRDADAYDVLSLARGKTDPLDVRLMAEQWLLARDTASAAVLFDTLRTYPTTAQQVAAEYADAGLWRDGTEVLTHHIAATPDPSHISPLVYYYLGEFAERLGDPAEAANYRRAAEGQPVDYVFPFQSELAAILRRAIEANPDDARAPYYLGNLLFDRQPDEAIALWEQAVVRDPRLALAWRNLAQAYAHQSGEVSQARAVACLEKAVAVEPVDPTHLAELDRLYEQAGAPVEQRLALLEPRQSVVVRKEEGLARLIGLLTFAGKADDAISLLEGHTFSVWEGGTSYSTGDLWADAHLVRGLQRFRANQYRDAINDFKAAAENPSNLRAREQSGGIERQAELGYWIGCAYDGLGQSDDARKAWSAAAAGPGPERPSWRSHRAIAGQASGYYQALCLRRLGETERAEDGFQGLVAAGSQALDRTDSDPSAARANDRVAEAHYIAGLGYAGLGRTDDARDALARTLAARPDHLGAKIALAELEP